MWRVRSAVDPAAGLTSKADYFVVATVARFTDEEVQELNPRHGKIFVLDIYRARLSLIEQAKYLEHHYETWRPYGLPYVLVEKVLSQTALFQYLTAKGLCPLRPCGPTIGRRAQDKETRNSSLAARYEQGQIIHPRRAGWLRDYETELLQFPRGEHDDMVDAVTYAVDDLTLGKDFGPTRVKYVDFTFDADMPNPRTDESGLYSELGVQV